MQPNRATTQAKRSKRPLLAAITLASLATLIASALPAKTLPAKTPTPQKLPAPPATGEMGFVLTSFVPAVHQGQEDCPDGAAGTVRENFLATQTPEERARLSLKANEPELTKLWKATAFGPDNTNICTNPEAFERPNQKTVQGKLAYGLNLDNDTTGHPSSGCAHANFTGTDGATGVDNQAYRALGCTRNWRGVDGIGGDIRGFNNFLATGEHTMVLLLRGVDSLKDDADVTVILASTDDRPVLDSKRQFITGSSFTMNQPAFRNVLKGQIHNGVLTTQPTDAKLNRRLGHGGVRGARSFYDLRQARLQLTLQPDGTIKGLLGAYQTPRNMIESTLVGGQGAATVAGIDCAAEYRTLQRLSDGLKNPKTGQCEGVSSAYEVAAVPAFVNDPQPTAAAKS